MRFLKFRSLSGPERERTLDIIRTKSFYIANFSELNDPFDSNFPFNIEDEQHTLFLMHKFSEMDFDDEFSYWLTTKAEHEDYKTRILAWLNFWRVRRKIYQKLFPAYGVVSFSKKNGVLSHPLMWAHYADSHKGICFELKNYSPLELKEVDYIKHLPKINILRINDSNVNELFWKKGKMWKYEKEIRFITEDPNAKRLPFPATSLKAIYFGVNVDWKNVEVIQDLVKESGMTVKYGHMTPSTRGNLLEVIGIPPVSKIRKKFVPKMNPITGEIKKAVKDIVLGTVYEYRKELKKRVEIPPVQT